MEIDQQIRSQVGTILNYPIARRGYDRSYSDLESGRGRNNLPRGRGRGGRIDSNRRWSGADNRYSNNQGRANITIDTNSDIFEVYTVNVLINLETYFLQKELYLYKI